METGSIKLQVLAAVSATLVYLTSGTFLGWTSPTCPKLMGKDSHLPITSDQCSWIISFTMFGSIFGPIPTGYFAEKWGRKAVLATSAVPFVASWLMVMLARSVEELYASRFLAGLGQGIAFSVGPTYIAEISEDRIRGAMGTLFQVMLNLGTVYEYSVGPYVPYNILAVTSAIFPFIFLLTFVWMPESPYYLLSKERREDAERSLMKLRGRKKPEAVKEELEMMQLTVTVQKKSKGTIFDLFRYRGSRKACLIVFSLISAQVFSGIIAVLSYIASIFTSSGSGIDASMSAIIVGLVTLFSSVLPSLFADRLGRKPLLILSSVGCSLCMLGLGVYFYYAPVIDKSMNIDWIPLALMIIYIITYMLGLGPLPWAIAGEVFPSSVKSIALSITSMIAAVLTLTVVKMYQLLADGVGEFVVFWIFATCCAIATIIIIVLVPETKGKSFLDIYRELDSNPNNDKVDASTWTVDTVISGVEEKHS